MVGLSATTIFKMVPALHWILFLRAGKKISWKTQTELTTTLEVGTFESINEVKAKTQDKVDIQEE